MRTKAERAASSNDRSQPPLYGFFILNRHGVENFSHYLEDEAALELTPEYIIVQGDDGELGFLLYQVIVPQTNLATLQNK
jgi:hypothetical protein